MRRAVRFVPDYHWSPQFAGVQAALDLGLFRDKGLDVSWSPPPSVPGAEAKTVAELARVSRGEYLTVGSCEQNVLVPEMQKWPVKAFAAMFGRSPLALACSRSADSDLTSRLDHHALKIGAHVDTVELLQRLCGPRHKVVSIDRQDKLELLASGQVDAVQIYTVMEGLKLGESVQVVELDGWKSGVHLGYSQVLFAQDDDCVDGAQELHDFCSATFQGWAHAIQEPDKVAESMVRSMDLDAVDHWSATPDFMRASIQACGSYVKQGRAAGKLGVIDEARWDRASRWILDSKCTGSSTFGLARGIWEKEGHLSDGDSAARDLLERVKAGAQLVSEARRGVPPQLVVVHVGNSALGSSECGSSAARLPLAASASQSWFDKASTGANHGVEVDVLNLAASTSTLELERVLRLAASNSDGIQLMLPLPDHIDSARVLKTIPKHLDVDGAHFVAEALAHKKDEKRWTLPVTPSSVMELLGQHDVDLQGKSVVIIGRSRIVGLPLFYLMSQESATVTLAHRATRDLANLCRQADLVVSAAGCPGLVQPDWLQPGAVLVNVGSTFQNNTIVPDYEPVDATTAFAHCSLVIPSPGGVGPLAVATLLANVVQSAASKPLPPLGGKNPFPTIQENGQLVRHFSFPTHHDVVAFVEHAKDLGEQLDHHIAELQVDHLCEQGTRVTCRLYTTDAGYPTKRDEILVEKLDQWYRASGYAAQPSASIKINQTKPQCHETRAFRYPLTDEMIATEPPKERGLSKLLVCDDNSEVHHKSFHQLPEMLPPEAHLVFNESKVVNGRLKVSMGEENGIEMMLLSPVPSTDPVLALGEKASGQSWRAMVRSVNVKQGDVLKLAQDMQVKVEKVDAPWKEEGFPDGVEATIQFVKLASSTQTLAQVLESQGEIPIPPYLKREATPDDTERYQTIYANDDNAGSIAAPTAGLHFTNALMERLHDCKFNLSKVALHVGAGTFQPVTVDDVSDHSMHSERFSMSLKEIRQLVESAEQGRKIVPVGTTSVRVLESINLLARIRTFPSPNQNGYIGHLGQWEAYHYIEEDHDPRQCAIEALKRIIAYAEVQNITTVHGSTSLCIVPGFKFALCDALVTNFHAPDSTLMMLVAAHLNGVAPVHQAYEHAMQNGYKFLSYGDASLLFKPNLDK